VLLPATPAPMHLGLDAIQTKTNSASYTVIFRTDKFDRVIDESVFRAWRAATLNEFFSESTADCDLRSYKNAASVRLPGYFGSAFRMNCRPRGRAWTFFGNLYLSKRHQYCVFVGFPTMGADPSSAMRFLDSFKLINSDARLPR
jgi:hypothetical protein